jgi:cytochrome b subunit of formate dehydrogenase
LGNHIPRFMLCRSVHLNFWTNIAVAWKIRFTQCSFSFKVTSWQECRCVCALLMQDYQEDNAAANWLIKFSPTFHSETSHTRSESYSNILKQVHLFWFGKLLILLDTGFPGPKPPKNISKVCMAASA